MNQGSTDVDIEALPIKPQFKELLLKYKEFEPQIKEFLPWVAFGLGIFKIPGEDGTDWYKTLDTKEPKLVGDGFAVTYSKDEDAPYRSMPFEPNVGRMTQFAYDQGMLKAATEIHRQTAGPAKTFVEPYVKEVLSNRYAAPDSTTDVAPVGSMRSEPVFTASKGIDSYMNASINTVADQVYSYADTMAQFARGTIHSMLAPHLDGAS